MGLMIGPVIDLMRLPSIVAAASTYVLAGGMVHAAVLVADLVREVKRCPAPATTATAPCAATSTAPVPTTTEHAA